MTHDPSGRPAEARQLVWPAIIVASSIAVGIVTLLGASTPLRPALALWFLLLCPGMALVRLLRIAEWIMEWTLAIAVSIALETIIATVMIYDRAWSPEIGLGLLIAVSLGGAIAQLLAPRLSGRGVAAS
ncbi:MAG TPA: hypothetical protein VKX16_03825 [Chloroflexota bacterium]|nr:hypothetical protein [Chloroflexota bacterium]